MIPTYLTVNTAESFGTVTFVKEEIIFANAAILAGIAVTFIYT